MDYINRIINLPESHSFFLFGARGVGKTSLLKARLNSDSVVFIDLLRSDDFERYAREPTQLSGLIEALPKSGVHWIVIDEVQKAPALLDIVHLEIEAHNRSRMNVGNERPRDRTVFFALTGSSARKLKRGKANLLAGRALLRYLFPMTHLELPSHYSEDSILAWGSLPIIIGAENDAQRREILGAYVHTYLREEILEEQLARSAPAFRHFLEVAGQQNGEPINFASIGRDVGLSTPTIQTYFQILEDTLIAHRLDPFHQSVRKRQRGAPKYYFFDLGVLRALSGSLTKSISPHNYGFGKSFEHMIICEVFRLASYGNRDWRFSYLRTKDGVEIDLIIERPNLPIALIEIKSTDAVRDEHLKSLRLLGKDIPNSELLCFCQEARPRVVDGVTVVPWREGMKRLDLSPAHAQKVS